MKWLIGSSLRLRLIVVAAAAAGVVVGISQLREMPVDVLPEYAPTTVEIQTEALGLSAAEVEQLITVPLEQDLLVGVAYLEDIRSVSVAGLSRILMIFEPGTDLLTARQVVSERMTQAHALPHVSKPPQMLQPLSSTNRVMMVGLSSESVPALEMSVLARWTIVPKLLGVPGVSNVSVWGQQDRQIQVQVDPARLQANDVSLLQIMQTAGNALWVSPLTFVEASTPGTGGFIDTPNQRLGVQHLQPITTPADLAKVRVEGTKLTLGDVATVVENHQPLIGDAVVNDGRGLMLVVEKLPDANTLAVTTGVERAISELQPGMSGLEFDTSVYRPASYIGKAIDHVTLALIIGGILMTLMLGALLLRWRTVLVCLAVVPTSVVVAALVLWALGASMNAVVLAGLVAALVIVVDQAVVGVDAITRRLREQHGAANGRRSKAAAIVSGTLESQAVLIYATLALALASLPLFFLDGLSGAFLPDAAAAYLLAVAAAFAVGLMLTPALASLLLSGSSGEVETPPAVARLERGYGRALSSVVSRPRWAYLGAGAVLVAAIAATPFLGKGLLPTFKETEVLIRWDGPAGTSLPEMNRVSALASRELRSVPGVRDVGANIGRAVTGDRSVGVNSGEILVSIDDTADYDSTLASIRGVMAGYPGFSHSLQTYASGRAAEQFAGAGRDVVVRVYGEDLGTLRAEAEKVRRTVARIDGVGDASLELPVVEPTLEIEPRLAATEASGIKPGDVRRAAAVLLSGVNVGSLFEEQKVFDVVVWGTPETRANLSSILDLRLDTPDGGSARLGDVADVRIAANPAAINREAVSRYVDVRAAVTGRSRDAVVGDIESGIAALSFPIEYHAEVLSVDEQPVGRLIALGVAAAIGMFLLLQACFGSWRLGAFAFAGLPVALTGGVLAVLAAGGTLSLGSLIGLLAVCGLALRGTVLLVDRLRRLEGSGVPFGPDLVARAARERFAPVATTTAVVGVGMLTLVVLGGRAGNELLQPVAIVVLGGVLTTALLTLFVLPALYLRVAEPVVADQEAVPAAVPTVDGDGAAELLEALRAATARHPEDKSLSAALALVSRAGNGGADEDHGEEGSGNGPAAVSGAEQGVDGGTDGR